MSVTSTRPESAARADTVVVLAAGQGTRMRSSRPKVLHELCGRSMLAWVLDQALALEPQRVLVVVGHGSDQVRANLEAEGFDDRVRCVLQEEQLGTGHAVQVCLPELGEDPGTVVLLYGDMPLLRPESLARLLEAKGAASVGAEQPAASILTCEPRDPRAFGRILRDERGADDVTAIVEEKDCTEDQRAIREVNLGVYAFPGPALVAALPKLEAKNAQGEYYITDVVALMRGAGHRVVACCLDDEQEGIGVNTIRHLSEAREAIQDRILEDHMVGGVAIEDPATTYVDFGVEIGSGTRVLPCTVIRRGVKIGEGCEVGPFSHLRVGTEMHDGAEVGNFVEVKKSVIGKGTKAKHLTYMGDAKIGERANIGAGTVFANYDGKHKHTSTVASGAFVGSGTILVGPSQVGAGAKVGAGAVLKRNTVIPDGETWVGVPAAPIRRGADARAEE